MKRPVAVWVALVLLLLQAVSVFYGLVQLINLFSHYSVPTSTIIEMFGVRFGIMAAAAIACVVSVSLIWQRSNRGRWLAIGALIVLVVNYLAIQFTGPQSILNSAITPDAIVERILTITFGLIPTFVLIALLMVGKRTNAYFRGSEPETAATEPPPPPVFEG